MDDKRIVGMAKDAEYARWAHAQTRPEDVFSKPEALAHLRVIDCSYGSFAGLFASSILAEMGAEVIRIEPPRGDLARKMSPYGIMVDDAGLGYLSEGRNKLHATLNLKKEQGKKLFSKLAAKADVVIETFKPGYMDRAGLGYPQLRKKNGGLIYCAIHSYGQHGADAETHGNQPGYDIVDQARGVIMSITGEPDLDPNTPQDYKRPLKHGSWMGWYAGGAWAAYGILLALFDRTRTGKGQLIDCAPPEGLLSISNYVMQYFHMSGQQMPRAGNYDYAVFPYTYVKCKDGHTFISGFTDPNWTALCEIMNRPELRTQFPTIKERLDPHNQPTIQHEIEKFTTEYTSEELLEMVQEYSRRPDKKGTVVTGRLESPKDILERDHWRERQTFVRCNDPHYGEVLVANSTFKGMSGTPGRVKWVCRPIGADNPSVYQNLLGIGSRKLQQLKAERVV